MNERMMANSVPCRNKINNCDRLLIVGHHSTTVTTTTTTTGRVTVTTYV